MREVGRQRRIGWVVLHSSPSCGEKGGGTGKYGPGRTVEAEQAAGVGPHRRVVAGFVAQERVCAGVSEVALTLCSVHGEGWGGGNRLQVIAVRAQIRIRRHAGEGLFDRLIQADLRTKTKTWVDCSDNLGE